jgi:hypothetical protein
MFDIIIYTICGVLFVGGWIGIFFVKRYSNNLTSLSYFAKKRGLEEGPYRTAAFEQHAEPMVPLEEKVISNEELLTADENKPVEPIYLSSTGDRWFDRSKLQKTFKCKKRKYQKMLLTDKGNWILQIDDSYWLKSKDDAIQFFKEDGNREVLEKYFGFNRFDQESEV